MKIQDWFIGALLIIVFMLSLVLQYQDARLDAIEQTLEVTK